MRLIAAFLFLAVSVSAVYSLVDRRRPLFFQPRQSPPTHAANYSDYHTSKTRRVDSHWQDPRWLDLDIIYPVRRYHSPPPLLDTESPTYVHPVHLQRFGDEGAMRKGVDAMMDALLSVRRVPENGAKK